MDIKNLDLLTLQTQQMQQDITTQGLCSALNPKFRRIANEVELLSIYANIANLPENIVDELAYQMHVDYYDKTASLEVKRNLVKTSIIIHRTKGTKYAVEKLIETVFGDGYIQEWFEYDGEPYMFKVLTTNTAITGDDADKFIRMLDTVKNIRSHLEEIIITMSEDMNLYMACVVHTGDKLTIEQVI
jgi:phage tail P2-like protein